MINKKSKEDRINKLFAKVKDFINTFISTHPFVPLYKLRRELESIRKISKTTLSKYIKKLGYSRKRARNEEFARIMHWSLLTSKFIERFDDAILKAHTFVCIDECGFSENLRPLYGFSKKGEPLIIKTSGGWTHYSLLMAIFQSGKTKCSIKKGSITKVDFQGFINKLNIDESYSIIMRLFIKN